MTRISDTQKKVTNHLGKERGVPVVALADVQDANNVVNHHLYSGCNRGAVVIASGVGTGAAFHSMLMKTFIEPTSRWVDLVGTLTPIVPAGYTAPTSRKLSDVKPVIPKGDVVNSTMFSVVPVADLADQSAPINQYHLSGKRQFTFVIGADETNVDPTLWTYTLYMATAGLDVSPWVTLNFGVGAITPSGGPMQGHGNPRSDRTHKRYNVKVTSLGIPAYQNTDVVDIDSNLNKYYKQYRDLIIDYTDDGNGTITAATIRMSAGKDADSDWLSLNSELSANITPA